MSRIHNPVVAFALAIVVVSGAAIAQRNAPKCTPDDPCAMTTGASAWTTSSGNITVAQASQPVAIVSQDGEVVINWQQADKTVAAPDSVDPMTLAIARLMVAIRDGTWKPAGETK